jgi:hypothetical protein
VKTSAAPLLVLLGVLPGCSLFTASPPDVTIQEKPTPVVCDTTAVPDPIDTKDTPPTLVMNPAQVWGYWFDSELYAAIAENLQAMRRWMDQATAIRKKLVACIDDHNRKAQASPSGP